MRRLYPPAGEFAIHKGIALHNNNNLEQYNFNPVLGWFKSCSKAKHLFQVVTVLLEKINKK